jgi:hypothetical protein
MSTAGIPSRRAAIGRSFEPWQAARSKSRLLPNFRISRAREKSARIFPARLSPP